MGGVLRVDVDAFRVAGAERGLDARGLAGRRETDAPPPAAAVMVGTRSVTNDAVKEEP